MIISVPGINWIHYYNVDIINEKDKICRINDTYRIHKGDSDHPNSILGDYNRCSYGIKAWREAGQPGGMAGLKANYKLGELIKISGVWYRTVSN